MLIEPIVLMTMLGHIELTQSTLGSLMILLSFSALLCQYRQKLAINRQGRR